jgi:hypothetical protein
MPIPPQSAPAQDKKSLEQKYEELIRKAKERKIILIGLLLGCILLFGATVVKAVVRNESLDWLYDVVRDVGIAFVVSAVVAFMLEKQSKRAIEKHFKDVLREFRDEVSHGLMKALGPHTSPELFQVVEESILGASFVRSFYHTEVELHDFNEAYLSQAQPAAIRKPLRECNESLKGICAGSDELVVLEMRSSYDVTNISDRKTDWVVRFQLAAPFGKTCPAQCGITFFEVEHDNKIKKDEPKLYGRGEAGGSVLGYECPVPMEPGERISVEIHAYALHRSAGSESWLVLIPSKGMEVRAVDMNDNKRITLARSAPNLKNEQSSVTNDDGNDARLIIKQFLLPYQGIEIKWSRRPADGTPKITSVKT